MEQIKRILEEYGAVMERLLDGAAVEIGDSAAEIEDFAAGGLDDERGRCDVLLELMERCGEAAEELVRLGGDDAGQAVAESPAAVGAGAALICAALEAGLLGVYEESGKMADRRAARRRNTEALAIKKKYGAMMREFMAEMEDVILFREIEGR